MTGPSSKKESKESNTYIYSKESQADMIGTGTYWRSPRSIRLSVRRDRLKARRVILSIRFGMVALS